MPDFAKTVVLDLPRSKLVVDGDEFPWSIPRHSNGIHCHVDTDTLTPVVTVSFFADAFEVVPLPYADKATP